MKKFILLDDHTKTLGNVTLFRIAALTDIVLVDGTTVKCGSFGGYVQAEKNLAQEGNCWLADDAISCGKALVKDSALVKDQSVICGRAQISGISIISGTSKFSDCAKAIGKATVRDQDYNGIDVVGSN